MVSEGALVFAMMAWINSTGMIEPAWPEAELELNVTNPAGAVLDMQRCGILNGRDPMTDEEKAEMEYFVAENLLGLYCFDRITLNNEYVDLETPEGQTTLVHELVHWIQDHNGDMANAECPAQVEQAAYQIGWEWQAQMGLPLSPDPFSVTMRSMCWENYSYETYR